MIDIMTRAKKTVKGIMPSGLWRFLHNSREFFEIQRFQKGYKKVLKRLRNKKGPLNVLFIAVYASSWKYDSLFQLMQQDDRFNPSIIVCPPLGRGREHMMESMKGCREFFIKKQYPFTCVYDEQSDSYVDVRRFAPDIVFFTNPYAKLVDSRYHLGGFKNSLTCFVNYGFLNTPFKWGFADTFHQGVWRFFIECSDNLRLIKEYSYIHASNCVVTGYPMYDVFSNAKVEGKEWKNRDRRFKRIIWAPHHTVSNSVGLLQLSTFELYYEVMLKLADKYKDEVQFVFKPHPALKPNLYNLESWGKDRTDAYFNQWMLGENTSLVSGDYVDLFISSDALIHDCGSFTIEYLYVQKPVLYLSNNDKESQCNEVGKKAYDCHYHATTPAQIEQFIVDVVLGEDDPLKQQRSQFYNTVLVPPKGKSVAENILDEIKHSIWEV